MLANSGVQEIVYHRGYPKDSDKVERLMELKRLVFRRLEGYAPPEQTIKRVTS